MKKIYILICAIAISFSAVAQISNNYSNATSSSKNYSDLVISEDNLIFSQNPNSLNSSLNIIWESDFSDPTLWTIDNSGQGGGAFGWTIDAVNDGWYSQNGISSTSGGNFAELSNGDPTIGTQMLGVTYTMTTALPIDIGAAIGSPNAVLSFEEFGARFNDLQEVQISLDGITFTTVADNLNYSVLSQSGGSAYANPTTREITLAPFIQANTSTVWVRFSWTTNYPTQATNANVWIAYGWYIDDVKIYEAPSNSISMIEEVMGGWWVDYLTAGGLGQDYTFYPISQATANPYAFESVIINEGSIEQQVTMYAEVYDGLGSSVFNSSSNAQNLGSIEQDTFICNSFFTPTATDVYSVEMWSIADSLDQGVVFTYSDTATKMTMVTDYVYGKDLNNPSGEWRLNRTTGTNGGGGFEISSNYDIYADETLYSIEAHITDWSIPGAIVYGVLYEEDIDPQADPIPLDLTDDYTIQSGDAGNWITLSFSSAIDLYAGTSYRISIGAYYAFSDTVGIDMSGSGDYSSQGLFDKDDWYDNGSPTWYTIADMPMLRMNFDPGSVNAISDIKEEIFSIHPNPASDFIKINLDMSTVYDVAINNLLGQTVLSANTVGKSTLIDLSKLDKGIYTIKLSNNNSAYSKKLIVE